MLKNGVGNIHAEIDNISEEINSLQKQINTNIEKSRELMREIYANNGRLAECETIAERFGVLRSQYQSDIERLTFVINGGSAHTELPQRERCPFCEGEIKATDDVSYKDATRSELQHIRTHLTELAKAERDIATERASIESTVKSLEAEKRQIDASVSAELTPQLTKLKEKLILYRQIIEINKELEVIQGEERTLNSELYEKETEEKPTAVKHDINQQYESEMVQAFEEKLISILQTCNYEGAGSARLNMETFDLEVGGSPKANSNGGGYCGFLNLVVALAFAEFLETQGEYPPGVLIVDSPLTQLSEPTHKEAEKKLITGLLEYLTALYANDPSSPKSGVGQIIILDHKDKLPLLEEALKDTPNSKIIEFTQDKENGRYGFLEGVYQPEGM